ncbi:MAG: TerB family tellurite resistance protein [Acidobacteria bacterium]|nr:TerB family tellurite resistance protein [Acidobacteriota bacterium]
MTRTEFDALSRGERLQLLRFVTSFAWADLEVSPAERSFIHRLVSRLHLDAAEARKVEEWIKVPPPPDDIDPTQVPHEHRQLLISVVREMLEADGDISEEERENLALLEQLTR